MWQPIQPLISPGQVPYGGKPYARIKERNSAKWLYLSRSLRRELQKIANRFVLASDGDQWAIWATENYVPSWQIKGAGEIKLPGVLSSVVEDGVFRVLPSASEDDIWIVGERLDTVSVPESQPR